MKEKDIMVYNSFLDLILLGIAKLQAISGQSDEEVLATITEQRDRKAKLLAKLNE